MPWIKATPRMGGTWTTFYGNPTGDRILAEADETPILKQNGGMENEFAS